MCKKIQSLTEKIGFGFEAVGFGSLSINLGFEGIGFGSLSFAKRNSNPSIDEKRSIMLSLAINNVCTLGCKHCVAHKSRNGNDNYQVIIEVLKSLHSTELKKINFASFASLEPTETPERISEMADFFHQNGIKTILMTNAIKLESCLNMLSGKIDFLDPSIDGLYKTCKPALVGNNYSPAWRSIRKAVTSNFAKKTGIIVTVRNENLNELSKLLNFFEEEFGDEKTVSTTIWFYLGENLLSEKTIMKTIKIAIKTSSGEEKIRIAIPGEYNGCIDKIFEEFNLNRKNMQYCSITGIPSQSIEEVPVYFPGITKKKRSAENSVLLRIEAGGNIYLGCSHLHNQSPNNYLGPIDCLEEIISSF